MFEPTQPEINRLLRGSIFSSRKNSASSGLKNAESPASKSNPNQITTQVQQSDVNNSIKESASVTTSFIKPDMKAKLRNEYKDISNSKFCKEMEIDDQIMCGKMEKSPLNTVKNPRVTVDKPKKTQNMFSSKTSYIVKQLDLNTEVFRQFDDFLWLQEILKDQFPGTFVSLIYYFM